MGFQSGNQKMNSIDPDQFYLPKDLATILRVGVKSISREINAGRMRAAKVGKTFVVQGSNALEYMRDREAASATVKS
jgi:hypothetical protein